MKTSMRNLLLNLAAIGLLALFLVWVEANLDGYKVQILNLIAVNAILALSLNLIYGFTGMFSLGHAGFMAIGAYVSALCVLPAAQKEMMWILEDIIWPFSVIHTPFWFSVVAGGFVAAIFGLFIAIPVLRLGGDYLGAAAVVAVVARQHSLRVVVEGVEPHHVARHVVIELYRGVHAEQQRSCGLLRGRDVLRGQALLRQRGRVVFPAPGEGQHGGGSGGDTYRFDVQLLHLSHLLIYVCLFLFFAYTHRLRRDLAETGVGGKIF